MSAPLSSKELYLALLNAISGHLGVAGPQPERIAALRACRDELRNGDGHVLDMLHARYLVVHARVAGIATWSDTRPGEAVRIVCAEYLRDMQSALAEKGAK